MKATNQKGGAKAPPLTEKELEMEELTEDSKALFIEYLEDAGNWSGTPLVGGNVESNMKNNGHITDLKKKGLITTFEHEFNRGQFETFMEWTQKGIDYARTIGLTDTADYIVTVTQPH